uniref:UPAR/Ly6 domain-containing protein n=1 Tax=Cebus imitator TaxID=2715852 RepID=A0A2K5RIH8_CEBIM
MNKIRNGGTCLSFHFLFGLEIRMRRIVFAGGVILSCLLGDIGGMICRACNLSIPFHGCLLDLGTCKTKPGQYCIKEVHIKGGIEWYSIKGCTKNISECFKRIISPYEIQAAHCCHRPMCNL